MTRTKSSALAIVFLITFGIGRRAAAPIVFTDEAQFQAAVAAAGIILFALDRVQHGAATPVPEPAPLVLVDAGAIGLAGRLRRRETS